MTCTTTYSLMNLSLKIQLLVVCGGSYTDLRERMIIYKISAYKFRISSKKSKLVLMAKIQDTSIVPIQNQKRISTNC